jgi:hypothetical protein
MKYVFLFFWFICTLLFGGLFVFELSKEANAHSIIGLAIVMFYSICLFMLIKASYPKEIFLDDQRKGYWFSWLFLPVAIFLTNDGISVILSNSYQQSSTGRRRILANFMNFLAENFGAWLPGSLMMIMGLIISAPCIYGVFRFSGQRQAF